MKKTILIILLILTLLEFNLQAYYPLQIFNEFGYEWIDYGNCTNAVEAMMQDREEWRGQCKYLESITNSMAQEIKFLKPLAVPKKDSALTGILHAWLPPIFFVLGVYAGIGIAKSK